MAEEKPDPILEQLEQDFQSVETAKVPAPNRTLPDAQQWTQLKMDFVAHNRAWGVEQYKQLGAEKLEAMQLALVQQNINWLNAMIPSGYSPFGTQRIESLEAGLILKKLQEADERAGTPAMTAQDSTVKNGVNRLRDYFKTQEIIPRGGWQDDANGAAKAAIDTLDRMEEARLELQGKSLNLGVVAAAQPQAWSMPQWNNPAPTKQFNAMGEVPGVNTGALEAHPSSNQPTRTALDYVQQRKF